MDKDEKAIARIKQAYQFAQQMGNTLIVAYSGGKDSDVLLDLAIKSGVSFQAQHNHTTADAPQTVYHIREVFQSLEDRGIPTKINMPPDIEIEGKTVRATMWNLIPKKMIPPTRLIRYCCQYFKERKFENQHIMTGVRWDESNSRAQRGIHERLHKDPAKRTIYIDENDDSHKLTEICQLKNRIVTNPIIDWTDRELWSYIHDNNIRMNPCYTMGYARVGCIGCPMASKKRYKEFKDYPKYKGMYMKAFERMLEERNKHGKPTEWKSAKQVMRWWLEEKFDETQIRLYEEQL